MPTGFNRTEEYHSFMNTTLTFEWNPPHGSGPEVVVDNYILSISPTSHPGTNIASSFFRFNVTLVHNVVYNVSIVAANCAGTSEASVLYDLHIGKYVASTYLWNLYM